MRPISGNAPLIFLDILRQSGSQQADMTSRAVNAVLIYDYEVILKGSSLPRPVNYALVRVVPPLGTEIDETKRPVVVIDPRAGQGPGIGGFQAGERDRPGVRGRPSRLLHRLHRRTDGGPDDRGHRTRAYRVPAEGD